MKNLISMTDLVLEQDKISTKSYAFDAKVVRYANFLKQPLKLWMFVPCDENGNVLEEPERDNFLTHGICRTDDLTKALKQHQQAKERCLFEGFNLIEISKNLRIIKNEKLDCQVFANQFQNVYYLCNEFSTIESLIKYNLALTPTSIKQIGL